MTLPKTSDASAIVKKGSKGAREEWERVRPWLCLQACRPWLVHVGSINGHQFWGLRVLGLFEKDL